MNRQRNTKKRQIGKKSQRLVPSTDTTSNNSPEPSNPRLNRKSPAEPSNPRLNRKRQRNEVEEWVVVPDACRKRKPTLIQSGCYKLGIRKDYGDGSRYKWRCNKRNNGCLARVTQICNKFFVDAPHTCGPDPSLRVTVPMYAQAKKEATQNVFKAASEIVEPIAHASYKTLTRKSRHYLPNKMCNLKRSRGGGTQTGHRFKLDTVVKSR